LWISGLEPSPARLHPGEDVGARGIVVEAGLARPPMYADDPRLFGV
jgi:hypothetical protein